MNTFLFDPRSTFLNTIFLGGDVGNHTIAPELRQIIAANQTKDAVRDLCKIQLTALRGQQESFHAQVAANHQLSTLNSGVDRIGSEIDQLTDGVEAGFGQLSYGIGQLNEGMQVGFDQIGIGLQTGFQAVLKGLFEVDARLEQQLRQQHDHMVRSLSQGFESVSDSVAKAAKQTVDAIEKASIAQVSATEKAGLQITDVLRNTDAVRALEHFGVGMNFMDHADFNRAKLQFQKSIQIYEGHFPTLFAYGFCCRVLDARPAAQDAFEAALAQAGNDPKSAAKQRSLASLYLGRLAFDRQDYSQARSWFRDAYRLNERMWVALVEGAASLMLDPSRRDRSEDASAVKNEFNRFGESDRQRLGPDAYLLWYSLALTLVSLVPDIAMEAFKHGAHGDFRVREKDRPAIVALLWELNPRSAEALLTLLMARYPWLNHA